MKGQLQFNWFYIQYEAYTTYRTNWQVKFATEVALKRPGSGILDLTPPKEHRINDCKVPKCNTSKLVKTETKKSATELFFLMKILQNYETKTI